MLKNIMHGETKYLVKSINKNVSCNKYMQIKTNSDDDPPLEKTLNMQNILMLVRSVSDNNRYHPQVLLEERLYYLAE